MLFRLLKQALLIRKYIQIYLFGAIIINLAVLLYFKYAFFLIFADWL